MTSAHGHDVGNGAALVLDAAAAGAAGHLHRVGRVGRHERADAEVRAVRQAGEQPRRVGRLDHPARVHDPAAAATVAAWPLVGLDAVDDILEMASMPVIFITAFPERLLTGERPEPTFLITKPFQPETVKAAISQALFFHPSRQKEAA